MDAIYNLNDNKNIYRSKADHDDAYNKYTRLLQEKNIQKTFSRVSRKINNVKIDKTKITKTVNVVEELNESISEKTGHSNIK